MIVEKGAVTVMNLLCLFAILIQQENPNVSVECFKIHILTANAELTVAVMKQLIVTTILIRDTAAAMKAI